jgi:uncharacterized protein
MNADDAQLSEAELNRLDRFLMDRLDDNEFSEEDKDPGIFDIASLDGFLTAIVSSPVLILPSQWLPALWGDVDQVWKSQEEYEEIFELLVRHMNDIALTLTYQPQDFESLFYERKIRNRTYLVVDQWCEGYCRGVALAEDAWMEAGEQMKIWLTPIIAFSSITGWAAHEFDRDRVEHLQQSITPNVRSIHAFWLAQREQDISTSQAVTRSDAKAGQNDPCACGSGKKYKHCCLH